MGSLTGVVASKSVTEASKGALRPFGNRPLSVMAKGRLTGQGLGCSPIKVARELGSERRETVRSLSIVGAGYLRSPDTSTRGPCWTDLWFASCAARCIAGYPRLVRISAESI